MEEKPSARSMRRHLPMQPPLLVWVLLLYPAWLLLQFLHETGHVIHAWLSGGKGISLSLPLIGFSRTEVVTNPHPLAVVVGGVIWGCVLPMIVWLVIPKSWSASRRIAKAFAGLCLIGNGVYLAIGWIDRIGDAGDLMKYGMPVWMLMLVGLPLAAAGLWLLHRLGTVA